MTMKNTLVLPLVLLVSLLLTGGCAQLTTSTVSEDSAEQIPENQPYLPSGVSDIQIPAELTMKRDQSMFINTESYAGGIMCFDGRVEITSLTDFFITTMQKNGWKMTGTIRYKNVLLAFVKPNKSCMISIFDTGLTMKTKVYIYVTEDITHSQAGGYSTIRENPLR